MLFNSIFFSMCVSPLPKSTKCFYITMDLTYTALYFPHRTSKHSHHQTFIHMPASQTLETTWVKGFAKGHSTWKTQFEQGLNLQPSGYRTTRSTLWANNESWKLHQLYKTHVQLRDTLCLLLQYMNMNYLDLLTEKTFFKSLVFLGNSIVTHISQCFFKDE